MARTAEAVFKMPRNKMAPSFETNLIELVPHLRAFSHSLCGSRDAGDDLSQQALLKAWQARASFTTGTNLRAWLFTIARNEFYSQRRRSWRQMPWDEEKAQLIPATDGGQQYALELSDLRCAMRHLSDEQREAITLVGAAGYSYEEAAAVCGCVIGTVKSRVARARAALLRMLDGDTQPRPVTANIRQVVPVSRPSVHG